MLIKYFYQQQGGSGIFFFHQKIARLYTIRSNREKGSYIATYPCFQLLQISVKHGTVAGGSVYISTSYEGTSTVQVRWEGEGSPPAPPNVD